MFVSEPPGKLLVFAVRYQGTPVTSLKTDMEILSKQLNKMNSSKSIGPDECHPVLLRETAAIVNIPLQKILTKHLWKVVYQVYDKVQMFLLYNKIKQKTVRNHKLYPVSLTCLTRRLCEKQSEIKL